MFDFDLKTYTWYGKSWDIMESLSPSDYSKVRKYLITNDGSKPSRHIRNIIYVCYMRGILPIYNFDNRR